MSTEKTHVEQVDLDIESILNSGADNIMIPSTGDDKKPSLFTRGKEDFSFLDKKNLGDPTPDPNPNPDPDPNPNPNPDPDPNPNPNPGDIDDILNPVPDDQDPNKGRPRTEKNGLIELANKLIEKKLIVPFEDDKPISEYTLKDFEELFEANAQEKERSIREQVPGEFFQSLPEEMQYAAQYLANGGTDLKGLFRTLASVEEIKTLDPENESDQRAIVRSYLQATNVAKLTADEIEEEINGWDDRGELKAKAHKFKPKLDSLQQEQVEYKLEQQAELQKQHAAQAKAYTDNIYKALEPAEINGLKLDKKTQNLLFSGLVQANYQSASGKQTNLLGHLLEKHQFVEPNHALVAEALWLLADPEGYKTKVREVEKKAVVADTVRKLKGEEKNKIASHVQDDDDDLRGAGKKPAGLPRPSQNFFKRTA